MVDTELLSSKSTAMTVSRPAVPPAPAIIDAEFIDISNSKGWFARKKAAVVLWNDKRDLEKRLKVLAKAVYGHEAAGLPRGHDLYVRLNVAIQERVNAFCTKHQVPLEPLEAQIPVISKARELAEPPKAFTKAKRGLLYWLVACFALLGLGFATGLFAVGYHWCLHIFHLG